MVSFSLVCLKTLLGFSKPTTTHQHHNHHCHHIHSPSDEGLHLISASAEFNQSSKVLSSLLSPSQSTTTTSRPESEKKKTETTLKHYSPTDCETSASAMSCCTESLGFESSDQMEEEVIELGEREPVMMMEWRCARRSRLTTSERCRRRREEVKTFPPPLTSLNNNGHPSFYLKPERKDGRLTLTQVRINRPEIMRASRQDGRLTLYLIKPEPAPEPEPEPQDVAQESETEPESVTGEDVEEENEQKWKLPLTNGESYRRCHVMNNHYHHHHHHHNMWSNNCVTTG